jgi:hypothetical protein
MHTVLKTPRVIAGSSFCNPAMNFFCTGLRVFDFSLPFQSSPNRFPTPYLPRKVFFLVPAGCLTDQNKRITDEKDCLDQGPPDGELELIHYT